MAKRIAGVEQEAGRITIENRQSKILNGESGCPTWTRTMNNASKGRCVTITPSDKPHQSSFARGLAQNNFSPTSEGRVPRVPILGQTRSTLEYVNPFALRLTPSVVSTREQALHTRLTQRPKCVMKSLFHVPSQAELALRVFAQMTFEFVEDF